jgi:hypothetical protein
MDKTLNPFPLIRIERNLSNSMAKKVEGEQFLNTSSSSETASLSLRIAQIISAIANPLLVALPLCFFVAITTAPNLLSGLL